MYSFKKLRQNFVVTNLERRLKQDNNGVALSAIEGQLSEMTAQAEADRKRGLPPEEYYQADRLLASLRVAAQTVRRTWNRFHAC